VTDRRTDGQRSNIANRRAIGNVTVIIRTGAMHSVERLMKAIMNARYWLNDDADADDDDDDDDDDGGFVSTDEQVPGCKK